MKEFYTLVLFFAGYVCLRAKHGWSGEERWQRPFLASKTDRCKEDISLTFAIFCTAYTREFARNPNMSYSSLWLNCISLQSEGRFLVLKKVATHTSENMDNIPPERLQVVLQRIKGSLGAKTLVSLLLSLSLHNWRYLWPWSLTLFFVTCTGGNWN